jgi:hypothetical protein
MEDNQIIHNDNYNFFDYYYPEPNEKVADWQFTIEFYNDLLESFESRRKNFPIAILFIKNEIEKVEAEIVKSKFDEINNGFKDFKNGKNNDRVKVERSFYASKYFFLYDYKQNKIEITDKQGNKIDIESVSNIPKGEMFIYLSYYANGYSLAKYYYYLQTLLNHSSQQMETTNEKLQRLSNEEGKFDLTKYDLVVGSVHPYFPKPILNGNEYHIYEGATGNDRFQYFKVFQISNGGKLCKQFVETYYVENKYRHEYYEDGNKLIVACEIDAIEKETGLSAYLKYWNDCFTVNEKANVSFHSICHFEALKEWYNLNLQKHIEKNESHYLIEDIKNADILKWKYKIYQNVEEYLKNSEITVDRNYSVISSLHASQLIQFYYWMAEQVSDPIRNETKSKQPKISIPAYAIMHVYLSMFNGQAVTQQNKKELAKKYGYNSGDQLRNDFTKYQNEDKRLDLNINNKKAANAHLERIKSILSLLKSENTDAYNKANEDLQKLEKIYNKYH